VERIEDGKLTRSGEGNGADPGVLVDVKSHELRTITGGVWNTGDPFEGGIAGGGCIPKPFERLPADEP
jgi:hypothetical protein